MRVGYLSSTFDLLNVADLDVIAQAAADCDRLVVGVFSDAYAADLLGRPPVVSLEERLALVRHVRGVSEVVVHDDVDLVGIRESGVVFAVTTVGVEDQLAAADGVTWLTARRETISSALRDALRPLPQSAVA